MSSRRKLLPQPRRFTFIFWLLQESLNPQKTRAVRVERKDHEFDRIRCPLCQWRPNASSRWYCADCDYPEKFFAGCGTAWNTFMTRGRCPGCSYQWRWTSCLRCAGWSRHEDWYTQATPKL